MQKEEKIWKFYPGCSITEGFGADYQISNLAVLHELGKELNILDDWNCCGAVYLSNYEGGRKASTGLGALNLAKATQQHANLFVGCSECYRKLLRTKYYLKTDEDLKHDIDEFLLEDNMSIDPDIEIEHLLDYYREVIGLENIKKALKIQLKGLRVYPYIGCLFTRPNTYHVDNKHRHSNPEHPTELNDFLEALGAEVTHSNYLTECCGASCVLTKDIMANTMLNNIFQDALSFGADVIVTVCPMCKFNLDSRQIKIKMKKKIPILQFTQLLGLALEISPKNLGLNTNITTIKPLLSKIEHIKHIQQGDQTFISEEIQYD